MNKWQGRKILVIGAARQGLAASRYLAKHKAEVLLNDFLPSSEFPDITEQFEGLSVSFHFGDHPLRLLQGIDLVCVSGGVPLTLPIIGQARKEGIPLTNDSQIFMEAVKAPVIGITGSAGKTTTTVITGAIGKSAKEPAHQVWVGGNIGTPLIKYMEKIKPGDWVILELSSFQLELMTISPQIAVVLNVTPNHLDRHKSMAAYTGVKARILEFQQPSDIAVLNRDDAGSSGLQGFAPGKLMSFGFHKPEGSIPGIYLDGNRIKISANGKEDDLLSTEAIQLPGQHNLANALAACCASYAAGFSPDAMKVGIRSVKSIPHRLELVCERNGVRWMNDSIATAPERVMAAIRALDGRLVLLLGGRDKDLPWDDLAALLHSEMPKVIVFGEAANLIHQSLMDFEKGNPVYPITKVETLEQAVSKAAAVADSGETVLLSPGGTSYDAYRDFEERGVLFRRLVEELA